MTSTRNNRLTPEPKHDAAIGSVVGRRACTICEYIGWLGPDGGRGFAQAVAKTASRMPDKGLSPVGESPDLVDVSDGDGFMFRVEDIRLHVQFHRYWSNRWDR